MRLCSVEGCARPHRRNGYCNTHWARVRRTGSPGTGAIKERSNMIGQPCVVDGCSTLVGPKDARGMCSRHYKRWTVHADPGVCLTQRLDGLTVGERFWARIDMSGDCWLWTGALNADGYGAFSISANEHALAHRFAYHDAGLALPVGTELDHTCHTRDLRCVGVSCPHRRCVNPDHLEPVTHRLNVLRGNAALRRCRETALATHRDLHPVPAVKES